LNLLIVKQRNEKIQMTSHKDFMNIRDPAPEYPVCWNSGASVGTNTFMCMITLLRKSLHLQAEIKSRNKEKNCMVQQR